MYSSHYLSFHSSVEAYSAQANSRLEGMSTPDINMTVSVLEMVEPKKRAFIGIRAMQQVFFEPIELSNERDTVLRAELTREGARCARRDISSAMLHEALSSCFSDGYYNPNADGLSTVMRAGSRIMIARLKEPKDFFGEYKSRRTMQRRKGIPSEQPWDSLMEARRTLTEQHTLHEAQAGLGAEQAYR